jgi:hypothetical protein
MSRSIQRLLKFRKELISSIFFHLYTKPSKTFKLTMWSPMVTICTTCFNNQQLYILYLWISCDSNTEIYWRISQMKKWRAKMTSILHVHFEHFGQVMHKRLSCRFCYSPHVPPNHLTQSFSNCDKRTTSDTPAEKSDNPWSNAGVARLLDSVFYSKDRKSFAIYHST